MGLMSLLSEFCFLFSTRSTQLKYLQFFEMHEISAAQATQYLIASEWGEGKGGVKKHACTRLRFLGSPDSQF